MNNNNIIIKDKINNEIPLTKEKRNETNYSNNNINLLNIFKNNIIKRKDKVFHNEVQIDNSKNCSLSSSYSINFYNNVDMTKINNNYKMNNIKYNKNENKMIRSTSGNCKYQNKENAMNNINKSLHLINLYKHSKDKYCYIVNKKANKDKTKKYNNVTKNQSCNKIESYNYKNGKIICDSKKYEKSEENILPYDVTILTKRTKNNMKPLETNNLNLNKTRNNKNTILSKIFKEKKLTPQQKAYYILITSPILRLKEQIILSYRTPIIKNNLPISTILKNHEIILENKIKELNEEINLCSDKLAKPFVASKIADVTLNFITSFDEKEFKDFDILTKNKDEIKLYYNLIKILYLLFDEQYDKNKNDKTIKNELFNKIHDKGFTSLKDYLYFIYIGNKKKINGVKYIEEINEIIKNEPHICNNKYYFRMCRFISFSIYLVREIINYANNIRDTIELKLKTKQFLEIVVKKYNKIKNRNKNMIMK